jgi:predicted HAD superfamily Cof-like phosphohydrolase
VKTAIDDVRTFMKVAGQRVLDEPAQISVDFETKEKLLYAVEDSFNDLDDQLAELHAAPPADEGSALVFLRARLLLEETRETVEALATGDRVAFADGLADLIYVAIGAALAYGIPLEEVWSEVQRSNMSKFVKCEDCDNGWVSSGSCRKCSGIGLIAIRDAGGKVQKPDGWTPPNIRQFFGEK